MFYIGLYREKHEKIYLSETIRPRACLNIWYVVNGDLVDLYQVCSNYPPGAKKNGPAPWGHMFYIGSYIGKTWKIFLSETIMA